MQTRQLGKNRWVLVLERDEEIVGTVTAFLLEKEIRGGFLSGIGSVKNVTLGYYDLEEKEYQKRTFEEVMELGSLFGSIGSAEGRPFPHLHATVCGPELIAFTGHLVSAEVAVSVELILADFGVDLPREMDEEAGLRLLRIEPAEEPPEEDGPPVEEQP